MRNLLTYFRKELQFLNQQGKYFSRRFPAVAQKLGMSKGNFDDPHIARLMESFALLTAQLHQRLDEDIPEIFRGVMQNLAPQLLTTFPSVCIVQFTADRIKSGMTQPRLIAPGFQLDSTSIADHSCRFVTHYPVNVWPATLSEAQFTQSKIDGLWRLKLTLSLWPGASPAENALRVCLMGGEELVNTLHALLTAHVKDITLTAGGLSHAFAPHKIVAVGFNEDELMLHKQAKISPLHSLMLDFALFPQRFHFIDLPLPDELTLSGPETLTWEITVNRCWLTQALPMLASLINADNFQLNCTPAMNLFQVQAEPITLHPELSEHPVVCDVNAQQHVAYWSVKQVRLRLSENDVMQTRILPPLSGLTHFESEKNGALFWQMMQKEQLLHGKCISRPFIAFSDRRESADSLSEGVVMMELLCTNGLLPNEMLNGHPAGDFTGEQALPGMTIHALTRPSTPVYPPQGLDAQWRLISQLTLNHLLLSGEEGCDYLKETLKIYNFNDSPHLHQAIALIRDLQITPVCERLVTSDPHSLARGVTIEILFDPEARTFSAYTLFCCFLDRLLGLYAPVNSFARLITVIQGLDESRQQWPLRAGRLSWL